MKKILEIEPYAGGWRLLVDETLLGDLLKILRNAAPKAEEENKKTETYIVSKALF